MKQKKRPFPFTKQARRKKRRACFLRNAECSRTKRKIILRGLTAPGFGKDLARVWARKIWAVERAARVRRTWYGSRAEREESQTTVPFPLQKCVNCQSCFRERESCTERKITPRGLTALGFGKKFGRSSERATLSLVRQSCRTRRKSNRRSFFAEGADYVSKRFPGKRESHKEKNCPRGLTAPGFFQPKKVKAPFACLKTPLRSELI